MKQNDSKFSEALFYPYSHKIIQRISFITESAAYFFFNQNINRISIPRKSKCHTTWLNCL